MRELVATPHLRTRVLAGEAGTGRTISWAHVYDGPAPWEWLGEGELVMASGLGIPAQARAQRAFVERLDEAGATGLTISEHHLGPPVTGEMLAAADRLGFPLLETAWEVSYGALARAVADVGHRAAIALASTERIYSALHAATLADRSGGRLIAEVAASQHCTAAVLDRDSGRILMSDPDRRVPAPLIAAVAASSRGERRRRPAPTDVVAGGDRGVVVPLALPRDAILVVAHSGGDEPDPVVLRHLATVVMAEHERSVSCRRREQDRGAEVLTRALTASVPPAVVAAEVAERGLDGPLCLVTIDRAATDPDLRDLYFLLAEAGVPALTALGRAQASVVLPSGAEPVGLLLGMLDEEQHAGVSEPFADCGELAHAARQARWTLSLARVTGRRVVRHADHRLAAFLPQAREDARSVTERILGPLAEYDGKGVELVSSLRAFLEENRSWQRAAARLRVHKQTLVYRMRRVEELTGLHLDRTEDVSQLWLALRTRDLLG
ncbi:MAG TPA: PucR family transcriptional regulator ligand-binding domain-containing protein [Baekduia sp.]|uniref:PucR family transcriptional regulator n=1 Tax=Baekduia sp. TaxID=2600305 RepID=UPI002D795DB5|nr:PucR family transcriptional regulator ligand-binding domain-containing protein [Baekduia sp.]HET6509093.1 PucR family transcriptional regulator ligand-binding domain-containing protein [Baekduia sp.]